ALTYAAEWPERISHLIFVDGWTQFSEFEQSAAWQAEKALRGKDWVISLRATYPPSAWPRRLTYTWPVSSSRRWRVSGALPVPPTRPPSGKAARGSRSGRARDSLE